METRFRSVLKAMTWRVGGLVVTTAVAWVVTQRADVAASIGVADTLLKIVAYYGHERLWLRIRYGCLPPPDYEV